MALSRWFTRIDLLTKLRRIKTVELGRITNKRFSIYEFRIYEFPSGGGVLRRKSERGGGEHSNIDLLRKV